MRTALRASVLTSLVAHAGLPWGPVEVLERCGSTNAVLAADATAWRVVTTDHQDDGRGRLLRTWITPPLAAVALSAALPLSSQRRPDAGWVPLLTGLAVRDTLAGLGVPAGLKWPNDVLAGPDEEKVCGILCEVSGDCVVVGVGLNVDQTREELPGPPVRATSLALLGVPTDRETVVVALLTHLAARYDAWARGGLAHARLTQDYAAACTTLRRDVAVHLPDGTTVTGRAIRVDVDGRLVVATPDGEKSYAAGDVVHARIDGPA